MLCISKPLAKCFTLGYYKTRIGECYGPQLLSMPSKGQMTEMPCSFSVSVLMTAVFKCYFLSFGSCQSLRISAACYCGCSLNSECIPKVNLRRCVFMYCGGSRMEERKSGVFFPSSGPSFKSLRFPQGFSPLV